MRALIRNKGETVTQDMRLTFIDWDTGAPLTYSEWYGGPYALIEDYTPPQYDEEGEKVQISDKEMEIVELKARLAALEKEV